MPRESLRYLLLDLPSDHEIEGNLATECDIVYSLLANLELAAVTKRVRIARAQTLKRMRPYPYDAEIVHLAGHATYDGLWMLGEILPWNEVAASLAGCVTSLPIGQHRILNLSCCYSQRAAARLSHKLSPYFSGAYCFHETLVPYAKAIACWTTFFYKGPTAATHEAITHDIGEMMGGKVLQYIPYRDQGVEQLTRLSNTNPRQGRTAVKRQRRL